MTHVTAYQNVHGAEEFVVFVDLETQCDRKPTQKHSNVPAFASTVQKTKHWIRELMTEMRWEDAQKSFHGLRAVLHALRDRLTIHEASDFAAQLPMLLRGLFYECWQPDRVPVKDRTREAFLAHIFQAFPDDQSVDPEELTCAVFRVINRHISEGEMDDIKAIVPKPIRELFPKP